MTSNSKSSSSQQTIRIIPLGGLGEVGMNCMVVEHGDEAVLIDCGITFPDGDGYGVDIILPAWQYVIDNVERFSAILLTHGHEDHLGALPFLLKEVDIPVFGPPLALGLLKHKLREHGLLNDCELVEVRAGERIELDTMEVEFVHVNHSIPDATSVVLHTDLGAVVHTGDWRIDHTPIRGQRMDLPRFGALGQEGVVCMLGDSTNVESKGTPTSEMDVVRALEAALRPLKGRAVVTQFSSNVYRLQALMDIAHRIGRKVFVLGRSLQNMVRIASDLGLLVAPDSNLVLDITEARHYKRHEILVVCTGSQGEPRSALTRVAYADHRLLSLEAGDTVLFSARIVPGNEMAVSRVQNALWASGVEVINPSDAPIHTTGHAYRDDIELLMDLVQPRNLIPVHGELRMLVKHARLAGQHGFTPHLLQNGETLEITGTNIDDATVRRGELVDTGRVMVDGTGVGDVSDIVLRDRRQIAQAGMIIVFLVLEAKTGKVVSGPDLVQHGVFDDRDPEIAAAVRKFALEKLGELSRSSMRDDHEVAETLRLAVRRWFRKEFDRKPVVIPIVREL